MQRFFLSSLNVFILILFQINFSYADTWKISGIDQQVQNHNSAIQIELIADQKEIWIDGQISIVLTIKQKANSWINWSDINIPWIENFKIIRNSSSTKMNIINWDIKSIIERQFILKPIEEWVFKIWPVEIQLNWETIKSNQIEIKVWKVESKNNDGDWISKDPNSDKIDYLKSIKSLELWLLIFILWIGFYLFKSNKNIGIIKYPNKLEKKFIVPDVNGRYFLDKCLSIIKENVLIKNDLEAIDVSDAEIYKLEQNHLVRSQIKQVVDLIYDIKNWRINLNYKDKIVKLLNKIINN